MYMSLIHAATYSVSVSLSSVSSDSCLDFLTVVIPSLLFLYYHKTFYAIASVYLPGFTCEIFSSCAIPCAVVPYPVITYDALFFLTIPSSHVPVLQSVYHIFIFGTMPLTCNSLACVPFPRLAIFSANCTTMSSRATSVFLLGQSLSKRKTLLASTG